MRASCLFFLCVFAVPATSADLVSPFAGSVEQASFESDFDRFQYATNTGDGIEKITTEGRLSSRIFTKPEEKSTYEVCRSYANELEAAGFEVVATIGENKGEAPQCGLTPTLHWA